MIHFPFISARDCGRVALSETVKVEIMVLCPRFQTLSCNFNYRRTQLQTTIQEDYAGEIELRDLDPMFKYNIFRFPVNDPRVLSRQ